MQRVTQGLPDFRQILNLGSHMFASRHDQVTVMFADIVGFTPMCTSVDPLTVMSFLNNLFSKFDNLLDHYGVYKVETIGDCYVVAGGLIFRNEKGMMEVCKDQDKKNANNVIGFAAAIIQE
jgi:class 3 adenylate cyclase